MGKLVGGKNNEITSGSPIKQSVLSSSGLLKIIYIYNYICTGGQKESITQMLKMVTP